MIKKIIKQSLYIIFPLTVLSFLADWNSETLKGLRNFGAPELIPLSLLAGGILGIANLKGLAWSIELLTGNRKTDRKILVLGIFRLFILFVLITFLAYSRRVNLLALMAGMTIVFILTIKEGLKRARAS